jgi:hypothetical protein
MNQTIVGKTCGTGKSIMAANNESKPRKVIVKSKAFIFVIAMVLLILNLFLWIEGVFTYLEFLGVFIVVALVANAVFSLINRRNRRKLA